MLRKIIISLAKLCFGIFVVIIVGCLISLFVSHNFMEFVDSYGPEKFMDKLTELIMQFL